MENDAAEPTEPSIEAETQQPPVLPATEAKVDHTIGMLCHLLSLTLLIGVPLGNILGPLIVCTIIAAVEASKGTSYTYPLSIRFIK